MLASSHYSLVVERQPCKLKVLGSIPSGGSIHTFFHFLLRVILRVSWVYSQHEWLLTVGV